MYENGFYAYDPDDKTTWFSEVDSLQTWRFETAVKEYFRQGETSEFGFSYATSCVYTAIENLLIALHLYSTSDKVDEWKERIISHATTVASIRITPVNKNSKSKRLKVTQLYFFDDKEHLRSRMNSVKEYVDKFSGNGEMEPETQVISVDDCYRLYSNKIIKKKMVLARLIAKGRVKEIIKLIDEY